MTPKKSKNMQVWGSKMGSKWVKMAQPGHRLSHPEGVLEALGPKMRPRWPKMATNSPRAEGKAKTRSVYRGCTFCPALCCFELLWAALDYSGLL